jgi:ASC-1-like (ASCH) protein
MTECIYQIVAKDAINLPILLRAAMGISPNVEYKSGDEIIVNKNALSTWTFDQEKMNEAGIIINDMMHVKIINIKTFDSYKYVVKYTYIDKADGETKESTSNIDEYYIQGIAEEFPGDDLPKETKK